MQREKELKAQRDQDERLLEARKLAGMGFSVAEIEEELKRIKMVRCIPITCLAPFSCPKNQGPRVYRDVISSRPRARLRAAFAHRLQPPDSQW